MTRKLICLLCVLLAVTEAMAQEVVFSDLPKPSDRVVYRKHSPAAAWSIRNNLAWDATGSLNLGLEVALGKHASIGGNFGFKSWDRYFFWDNFRYVDNPDIYGKWRHLTLAPEFRWYPRAVSRGHFFGADLLWVHYNVGAVRFPLHLYPAVVDQRVQGDLWGAGLFYGYAFALGRHWRIETELGVAGGWYNDDAFECGTCGASLGARHGATLVPKLGVNVVYTFLKKSENK